MAIWMVQWLLEISGPDGRQDTEGEGDDAGWRQDPHGHEKTPLPRLMSGPHLGPLCIFIFPHLVTLQVRKRAWSFRAPPEAQDKAPGSLDLPTTSPLATSRASWESLTVARGRAWPPQEMG